MLGAYVPAARRSVLALCLSCGSRAGAERLGRCCRLTSHELEGHGNSILIVGHDCGICEWRVLVGLVWILVVGRARGGGEVTALEASAHEV